MPLVDMPLEKLLTYQGRNPQSGGFLYAYWDASLAEMHAIDPRVDLRPAAFSARGSGVLRSDLHRQAGGAPHLCSLKYARPGESARHRAFPPCASSMDTPVTAANGSTSWHLSPAAWRWRQWMIAGAKAAGRRTAARCRGPRTTGISFAGWMIPIQKSCCIAPSSWTRLNWRGSSCPCRRSTPSVSGRWAARRAAL